MYRSTKEKVHTLLHPELGTTRWDKVINISIIILIILNVAAVMLETVPSIYEPNKEFFHNFDVFSVTVFTVEYVLRVWSCNHDPKFKHSIKGRLKYMLTPGALIDLLAILPYFLQTFFLLDLRMLRILRLMRFFRLFRLTSYMKATKVVTNVFRNKKNELLLSFVLMTFLIIIASCLVYFAEHSKQPETYSSIPATIWWAVVTLTTVGYGDMYPITVLGKIFTAIILIAGVALFALPAGIITAGFLEELRTSRDKKMHKCPHCGKSFDEEAEHQHL
jgi:voltage-gated potassium channel